MGVFFSLSDCADAVHEQNVQSGGSYYCTFCLIMDLVHAEIEILTFRFRFMSSPYTAHNCDMPRVRNPYLACNVDYFARGQSLNTATEQTIHIHYNDAFVSNHYPSDISGTFKMNEKKVVTPRVRFGKPENRVQTTLGNNDNNIVVVERRKRCELFFSHIRN